MREDVRDYKYFKEDGNLFRIHIETDSDAESPREWDGNIGNMMCWSREYNLGDEHNFESPEDFLNNLVRENIKDSTLISFMKKKKTSNGLELKYNRKEQLWELWGYSYWSLFGEKHEPKFQCLESTYPLNFLIDDIVEVMSFEDKWKLLERYANIVYLPLYLYDYSGITMNTTGYSCRWDSGQVGYIFTTRERILHTVGGFENEKGNHCKVTSRNWKKAACASMRDEVSVYDIYLKNEVYGYIVEKLVDDDWEEEDSCWGFYSDKYGDDLILEIVRKCTDAELFDDEEELAA